MKLKEIISFIHNNKISDDFSIWNNIKCIHLKNNTCIYPNFNMRFKFSKNKKYLEIVNGDLQPFGFILQEPSFRYTLDVVNATGIYKTKYYDNCRFPEEGDVLRLSKNGQKLAEAFIGNCVWDSINGKIVIQLLNKLNIPLSDIYDTIVSFYTPTEIDKQSIVGDYGDGLYLNFIPYKNKKGYHQRIPIRKIVEIK